MSESENKGNLPLLYANWFQVGPSPFELALDFGYQAPDMEEPQRAVRLVVTWEHAKLLKQMFDQVIEIREGNVGEIARPPGVVLRDVERAQTQEDSE